MPQRSTIPRAVRDNVLKQYKYRCVRCDSTDPQVHHIDKDPSNNNALNLVPLCPNCHLNWFHGAATADKARQLAFFRRYNAKASLSPKFLPLLRRLNFLDEVTEQSNVKELRTASAELVSFVKALAHGDFYARKISRLLAFEPFIASVSIPYGGSLPQWYIAGMNEQDPRHRRKLRSARTAVYDLVAELLTYQDWQLELIERSSGP